MHRYYALIELVLVFGLVLAFAFFQLRSLKKLERERLARQAEEKAAEPEERK